MKKQALTISLLALTAMPASAAINCAVLPTCEELGYNNKTADCDSSNVLKCPFDQTKGKCLTSGGAVVGQVSYFAFSQPDEGWLKCDGAFYHKDQYPELYAKIKYAFGGSGDIFRVPNYANMDAFFKPSSSAATSTNPGCVPNIKGQFSSDDVSNYMKDKDHSIAKDGQPWVRGAFESKGTNDSNDGKLRSGSDTGSGLLMTFDASRYNSIYSDYCYAPTPSYIYMATFIYAGKKVTSASSAYAKASSCATNNYLYTDGTCSSTYTSGKTVQGIVVSASSYGTEMSVTYITGGTNTIYPGTTLSCRGMENACKLKGETYESLYAPGKMPTLSTSQYVVSNVKTDRYYCSYSSDRPYKCTSATSCSQVAAGTVISSAYYYCRGYAYFKK